MAASRYLYRGVEGAFAHGSFDVSSQSNFNGPGIAVANTVAGSHRIDITLCSQRSEESD